MQILIELIEHYLRQQRRYYALLRHAFTGRSKETGFSLILWQTAFTHSS